MYDIVTCDEIWIYFCEPEIKQQSIVWVSRDDSRPAKAIRSRYASIKKVATFFLVNLAIL